MVETRDRTFASAKSGCRGHACWLDNASARPPISIWGVYLVENPNSVRHLQYRRHNGRSNSLSGMAETNAPNWPLGAGVVVSGLSIRLEEIPGVASVSVDLTDAGGGINVRLEPGADEAVVMEKLRSLLVAYGVRPPSPPKVSSAPQNRAVGDPLSGVDVQITPIEGGARVEVATKKIRSFRVVAATPAAIAQGLTDAWCQVIGRIPVEVIGVSVADDGMLTVVISNGDQQTRGSASVDQGWEDALARAVGAALAANSTHDAEPKLAVNS